MGRGAKGSRRRGFSVREGSESDEDYVLDEEEEELNESEGSLVASEGSGTEEDSFDFAEEDEEEKRNMGRKNSLKPKKGDLNRKNIKLSVKRPRVSDDDDDDDEDYDCDFEEEDEEEKNKKVMIRSKKLKPKVQQSVKRARMLDDEDEDSDFDMEDEEDEEEEDEMRKVDRKSKNSNPKVRQSVKRARVSDDEEDYDFDEDEDYEDEDEDFTADEIDCIDEDEELEVKKKTSRVTKRVSRKKVSVKNSKGKRKSRGIKKKKPLRKKPKKSVRRRPVSSDDDFDNDYNVPPNRIRKKTGVRNQSVAVDWDSDFVSSGPSDHEYTMSDEEKLLVAEANRFCGSMATRNSSLSKRFEREVVSNTPQVRPMERKGKEKVRDLSNDLGKQVCGICFTEEGKSRVRGTLNCCSHYFCFACIQEWSKIESRCPLCKQRFVTISKSARSNVGIELRSTIHVPKRDQIYQPSEEEIRGYLDPYANVICMECQQGGDDSVMLLCDLCDSAAHTYCVGLGQEVPEGDWYCKGCWNSNPGSSNSLVQDSISTYRPSHTSNVEDSDPTSRLSVSIPDSPLHDVHQISPSPRYHTGEHDHLVSPSGMGANTLSGRRRLHHRIRNIFSDNRMSPIAESDGRNGGSSHANVKTEPVEDGLEKAETTSRHARLSNLSRSSIGTSNGSDCGITGADLERTNSRLASEPLHRCSRSFNLTEDSNSPRQVEGTPVSMEGTFRQVDIMRPTI